MIISNPTDQKITVTHLGTVYSVEPFGETDVPEATAIFWTGVHGFLSMRKEEVKTPEPKVVEEPVVEEVVEKKPAPKKSK